jgi:hypothetical protein
MAQAVHLELLELTVLAEVQEVLDHLVQMDLLEQLVLLAQLDLQEHQG